ncbi:hypothetical protein LCGC14_1318190 [marine sediment metagenome]|uniref:Terminase n=1 Tax=marine sediment metagenome TaxID=412755 RepID=A0A0F9NMK7_9ZZZZ
MGQPFPGPWRFKYHPWARAMHDCEAEVMVGQKGAQLCFTEVGLNKTFYNIDVLGNSVLYVLPASTPDASDFSTSRFDPALELSTHLQGLFSDVKNIGHKRAGSASLFIRGSRSRNQLKSIPVSVAIIDEVDEMVQANIGLIFERMSGQLTKQAFLISTPTIEHYGINAYYQQSSQDHWFFPCPHCSRLTELIFPECLIITAEKWSDLSVKDSHIICKECKHILSHEDKHTYLNKGQWVSGYTDRAMHGFHVSQLYSSTVRPDELATAFLKGKINPADEQEFFNSKLGIPHEPKGSRLSDGNILACTGQFKMVSNAPPHALVTMGIDVGKWIHYEVSSYAQSHTGTDVSLCSTARVLKVSKVEHFEELDGVMRQYGVNFAVIDANPERRKALEFAQRFYGHVKLCFYGRGINSKAITLHAPEQHTMVVDRTSWLDVSLGRVRRKAMRIPVDVPLEYKDHLKALVRITEKDPDGNPVGKYVNTSEDHYAHARNYNELALQLAASFSQSQDMGSVF